MSLPEKKCFIKSIQIEKGPNSIDDLIGSEIEKYFPFSKDDIYYDWEIFNEYSDYYDVLVSAAPKYIVDSYIENASKAGLSVVAIEPESVAICRALTKKAEKKSKNNEAPTFAIIDIGAVETFMVISSNSSIIMSMGIDVSGQEITEKIATTLQINESQAEKAKIICGLDKTKAEGIIYEILQEMIERMNSKIQSIINFYKDNYPDFPDIEFVSISGGGSDVNSLHEAIAERLKLEIKDADVFTNINEDIEKYSDSFTKTHNLNTDVLSKPSKNNKKSSIVPETISSKHNSSLSYVTSVGLALRENL